MYFYMYMYSRCQIHSKLHASLYGNRNITAEITVLSTGKRVVRKHSMVPSVLQYEGVVRAESVIVRFEIVLRYETVLGYENVHLRDECVTD